MFDYQIIFLLADGHIKNKREGLSMQPLTKHEAILSKHFHRFAC